MVIDRRPAVSCGLVLYASTSYVSNPLTCYVSRPYEVPPSPNDSKEQERKTKKEKEANSKR